MPAIAPLPPPSATLPGGQPHPVIEARQSTTTHLIIPSIYGSLYDSPSPGVIVGIVLGAVAGFLVLLLLFYSCLGFGPRVIPVEAISFRERPPSRKHSHHSVRGGGVRRSHSRRRSSGTVRVTETYETRTRERGSRGGGGRPGPEIVDAPSPPPQARRVSSSSTVTSDMSDDEDEIVVMEEHSPPRRKHGRRSGGVRRSGGYRDVYPDDRR
ncbi:hypothetical protein N3K66_002041 [Trichothecium roseum]|uniref:Uncharacterized protein n=1 Tax=Trichothecium roseum TaxID=47278 RepID=A0ACC0V8R5_9HYPO|nr:hypothetical protein N3K66_002041 [Trichothecium roseum]